MEQFGVLGGSGVTGASTSGVIVNGDVGSSPTPTITNFPPSSVASGFVIHTTNDEDVQQARIDADAAALDLASQIAGSTLLESQLNGQELVAGSYRFDDAADLAASGTLTLNGPGVFVFNVDTALTANVLSNVIGTADPCSVFWRVGSSATLNGTSFVGTVIAAVNVTVGESSSVTGRVVAGAAVTMAGAGGNTIGGCSSSTLIDLVSFSAEAFEDRLRLKWETAAEIDNAGFHLWRSKKGSGDYTRITQTLIPAKGSPTKGARYTYEDTSVETGKTYYYKLEDIDYSGQSTFHGPVSACAGIVDIKANGSDGPVVVSPDAPVSVSVDLNPGESKGQTSELWIAANTPFAPPFDWYTYVYPTGWEPGIRPCTQTPLFDLSPPVEILNGTLPLGNYIFYFGVDDPDGMAAGPWLGLDSVEVEVR